MKFEVERLPKKTVKFKITIETDKVLEARHHVVDDLVKEAELPGFRQGQAPRSLVEPKLDPAKIRGEVINHLVPLSYDQAVKESLVKPIILPRIEIESFEEGQELIFTATTCEAPEINLGDYKTHLSNPPAGEAGVNPPADGQDSKLILGPDGQPIQKSEAKSDTREETINRIFETLLKNSTVEIPDPLIEDEVNRMLGRLIDQTGRLGLSVDAYLTSVGKNVEELKNEYRRAAEKTLKLEFILMTLAKAEGVKLEEKEISDTINSAPDEESRKNLSQPENRTYLESVLIKNKVIQRLLEVANSNS